MAIATAGAIAALIGAASSVYGQATKDTGGPARQAALAYQQEQDAAANTSYQRMLSQLTAKRAVAGTQDSFGSTLQYDPATNTWVSKLGDQPMASDLASMQAGIRQNTTQARMMDLANEQASLRAARNAPAADEAQRNLANFRPMSRDALVGLLQNRATTAANETFTPLISNTLSQYARMGTDAAPALGYLGRTQADDLRKGLIDAQISGMTGADAVNASRRQGLQDTATTATSFANPQFQSTPVAPSAFGTALSSLLAQRAYGAAGSTAYGAAGPNTANKQAQDALTAAAGPAGAVAAQPLTGLGSTFSDLFKDPNVQKAWTSWFGGGPDVVSPQQNASATEIQNNAFMNAPAGTYGPFQGT